MNESQYMDNRGSPFRMGRAEYEELLKLASDPLPEGLRVEACPCRNRNCRGWIPVGADGLVWPWGSTVEEWAARLDGVEAPAAERASGMSAIVQGLKEI